MIARKIPVSLIPPSGTAAGGRRAGRNGKNSTVSIQTKPTTLGPNQVHPGGGLSALVPIKTGQAPGQAPAAANYNPQMHLAYEVKKLMYVSFCLLYLISDN